MSFAADGKWTTGRNPVMFVDSTTGPWKASVDSDEATWSVRGPDPDDEAHYASGEATNADVAGGSTLDLKGRIAAAKKQARAYITGQIEASGTKKTKAIMEAEIAAAIDESRAGISADAAERYARPGDRFGHLGDVYQVTLVERRPRVGQSSRGTITMAREVTDPFGRTVLIDHRAWPRDMVRSMKRIP